MGSMNYSRVPLSQTRAISNSVLSPTRAMVPSAFPTFPICLVEICPAISNTSYLESLAPLAPFRTTFSVTRTLFCRYLELFSKIYS